ncbi:hypothetical protein FSP39_009971 [Pinctada imbricata]|uniref:Protein FAM228B n=1 Tax=Pinctada imbricata TaxID=66713 RepID=A0AA88YDS5_PINIB|nr:hypothetical protein FSP39_009971 [Pinctada imbricata]
MTSLLCNKQQGGKVQVHSNEMIEDLAIDSRDHIQTMLMHKSDICRRKGYRPMSTPSPSKHPHTMDSQSLIGQTLRVQDWLNEKTVKGLQEKSDVETKAARGLYNPILETESTFVKDVDSFLTHKEILDLRKKELLHKKWNERVYEPLRRKIIEAMDSDDWPELDRRKRELHRQYLEFVNQKGHVFLETMDPSEYYAQALNGHRPAPIKHSCLKWSKHMAEAKRHFDHQHYKIATKSFRDPLLSQGRERSAEERTILRCLTGYDYTDKDIEQVKLPPLPLIPLGRHGTDSIRWLEMPLTNIESTPRKASRRRMRGTFNSSQLDFESWSNFPQNKEQVEKEMQTQKKRMFKETPPFRTIYREVPKSYLSHNTIRESSVEEEPEMLVVHNVDAPNNQPMVNSANIPDQQPITVGAS